MSIFTILAYLLLLGGLIVGYRFAMGQLVPRHWKVIVWSAVGGVAAAVLFIVVLLWLGDVTPDLRLMSRLVGVYAAFGLVFGIVALITRAKSTRRLVITGVVLLVCLTPRQRRPGPSAPRLRQFGGRTYVGHWPESLTATVHNNGGARV